MTRILTLVTGLTCAASATAAWKAVVSAGREREAEGAIAWLREQAELLDRVASDIRTGLPGTVWASGCNSWYVGDGDLPVLWPYDRRAWHAALRRPELVDYELLGAPEVAAQS